MTERIKRYGIRRVWKNGDSREDWYHEEKNRDHMFKAFNSDPEYRRVTKIKR
jgi:hypothetical protein